VKILPFDDILQRILSFSIERVVDITNWQRTLNSISKNPVRVLVKERASPPELTTSKIVICGC
jgi:hypothetical protein